MRRLLVLVLAVLVLGPAAHAHAHGDEGRLEVIEQTPSADGTSVTFLVALTYVSDGHGVDDGAVTATPIPAGGEPGAPVTLTSTGAGGGYEGTVTFPEPGRWTVQFDSADPEATVSTTTRIAPAPTTTAPPATTTAPDPTTPGDGEARLAADEDTDDDGPPAGMLVALAIAGALVVAAAAVLLIRRRAASDDPAPGP